MFHKCFFDIDISIRLMDGLIKRRYFVLSSFISSWQGTVGSRLNPFSSCYSSPQITSCLSKLIAYYVVHPSRLPLVAKWRDPWIALFKYKSRILDFGVGRLLAGRQWCLTECQEEAISWVHRWEEPISTQLPAMVWNVEHAVCSLPWNCAFPSILPMVCKACKDESYSTITLLLYP